MKQTIVVVLGRKWHNPEITITVSDKEIGISMALDDYIQAMLTELGSPTMIMTAAQLASKIRTARNAVENGMKQTSIQVV